MKDGKDTAGYNAMKQNIRELTTQVLVVGAGPSGIPAAIAAARAGAKVILLEEDQAPGGAPVDMYVAMACGSPRCGIYAELLRDLNERHTLDRQPIHPFNNGEDECNHWWMPHSYIDSVMRLMDAEPNLQLICGARVDDLILDDTGDQRRVRGVYANMTFGGHLAIHADVTIDATGTGLLGELAGCDVRYGSDANTDFDEPFAPAQRGQNVMLCTLMYITQRLSGTAMPKKSEFSARAQRSGFVEDKLDHWSSAVYDESIRRNVGIYLHWGASVLCPDTRDSISLGQAYLDALRMIQENTALWQRYGFTVSVAPRIGVRECRRIMGDTVITLHDIVEGRYPQDTIAVSAYGVDIWDAKKEKTGISVQSKPYGIPYRALLPKGVEGLLMAGKAISGSRIACSSYRVQPIVAAIGEAAGNAAALSVINQKSLRQIDVARLQQRLTDSTALPPIPYRL